MSKLMLDRKLRFSDVVYAIESTPKAVRNWLARGQVELVFNDGRESGWQEFSIADVVVLALVRKLVNFGMKVPEASDLANVAMLALPQGMDREAVGPETLLADHLRGKALLAWQSAEGEWHVKLAYGFTHHPPASSYAVILLEPVIRRAIERAIAGKDWDGQSNNADLVAALEKLTLTIKDATPSTHEGGE